MRTDQRVTTAWFPHTSALTQYLGRKRNLNFRGVRVHCTSPRAQCLLPVGKKFRMSGSTCSLYVHQIEDYRKLSHGRHIDVLCCTKMLPFRRCTLPKMYYAVSFHDIEVSVAGVAAATLLCASTMLSSSLIARCWNVQFCGVLQLDDVYTTFHKHR